MVLVCLVGMFCQPVRSQDLVPVAPPVDPPLQTAPSPGVSAPFIVDVSALFTNDLANMTYVELTNLLDLTKMDMHAKSASIPELRKAQREARMKALKENPGVQQVREEIEALRRQIEDIVKDDPDMKVAADALTSTQHSIMGLVKKSQLLTQEIWKRNYATQAGVAPPVATNTP